MLTPREIDEIATAVVAKLQAGRTERRLLNLEEISAYLGVSSNHIKAVGIPCLRLGTRRMYDPEEVIEWLRGQREAS